MVPPSTMRKLPGLVGDGPGKPTRKVTRVSGFANDRVASRDAATLRSLRSTSQSLPSAVETGAGQRSACGPEVTAMGFPPMGLTDQIFRLPLRSELKNRRRLKGNRIGDGSRPDSWAPGTAVISGVSPLHAAVVGS